MWCDDEVPSTTVPGLCSVTYFSCLILLSSSSRAFPCRGRVSSLAQAQASLPGLDDGRRQRQVQAVQLSDVQRRHLLDLLHAPVSTTTTPSPRLCTFIWLEVVSMATCSRWLHTWTGVRTEEQLLLVSYEEEEEEELMLHRLLRGTSGFKPDLQFNRFLLRLRTTL
ncbi:hypothetical protein INR49_019120 [Caranx melampygus]|nr:hypothetical protein INR49_019120 [Caranx melampygus]